MAAYACQREPLPMWCEPMCDEPQPLPMGCRSWAIPEKPAKEPSMWTPKAEELEEIKSMFMLYDTNKNGVLEWQVGGPQGRAHTSCCREGELGAACCLL
eukprot:366196-Chlamydomonas_euryale.AAC.12